MYSLKSSSARIVWKMEKKGCLQSGHSALFFDHSWTQRKQNLCKQRSRYATLSNLSRQMGHLESGDASVGSLLVLAFGEKLLSSAISQLTESTQYLPHFRITIWLVRSSLLQSTLEHESHPDL